VDNLYRVGRDLTIVWQFCMKLKNCGVDLYFAEPELDSRNEHCAIILTLTAMMDEQYTHLHRKKVLRGQQGRVMQGFSSGLAPFGYKHVPRSNSTTTDSKSRANQVGVTLEIVESEAQTIRRIYDMYANGLSIYRIAECLNEDGVSAVRKPHFGKASSNWSSNLIGRILRNEKYIGRNVWNKRMRYRDPATGKIHTCEKPGLEHLRVECPTWRIVSDEQWGRVQERVAIQLRLAV
jgi:site-specific DNA recombinase